MVEMAEELDRINKSLENSYVLIAAGRLGSSDKWLGIPCSWPQMVMLETNRPPLTVTSQPSARIRL